MKMNRKEEEIDRLYDMFNEGYVPKPVKILLILVSLFFGPILVLIDQISDRSPRLNNFKDSSKNNNIVKKEKRWKNDRL